MSVQYRHGDWRSDAVIVVSKNDVQCVRSTPWQPNNDDVVLSAWWQVKNLQRYLHVLSVVQGEKPAAIPARVVNGAR